MTEQRPQRRQVVDSGLAYSHKLVDVLATSAIIGTGVTATGAAVVGVVYVAGFPASDWFREVTVTVAALAAGLLLFAALSVSMYYLLYRIRGEHSHGGLIDGE